MRFVIAVYKLEIQVTDGKKVVNFMLWDQDCINLIGVSVGDLRKKMIKDGEEDPKCFPEDLDVLLGCTLVTLVVFLDKLSYKLEIQVTDGKKVVNFMLWDQDCINLIRVSVGDLRKKMIKDGEEDPKCFPEDLDVLLGCTLAFKVKPQGNNRPASVMRVSTDCEIIGHISSILGQTQAIEVGKRMSASESDVHTHTGSSLAMELAECGDNATCNLSANTDSSLVST
ncbi:hypothetical protein DEO72_LG3g2229 [Vigna unguiculata]|uniref:Nucleic acid-binding n=1 Tax=Vigna unguiculata TaxID=3917 RepID=A0A4D6LGA8_VIGUN|nr:hypothetical protein DEO72_LG3g2229 [Vigna unguiculata]